LFAHHVPPHVLREGERLRYQDQGEQEFRVWIVPESRSCDPATLADWGEQLNRPLHVHLESGHAGALSQSGSEFSVSSNSVTIGAIKQAEASTHTIVRAVERNGKPASASFSLGATAWDAEFAPFEIKTFRITQSGVWETDLLERPL
jgi:alpha-mannosidase